MKTKITQSIPALLVLMAIGFSYFSTWCIFKTQACYGTVISHIALSITNPLFSFAIFSLPLVVILIFIPRHIFNSWLKLAAWMIPLSFIYIATTPVNFTGMGLDLFPFYRDDAARLAGEVLSILSLFTIVFHFVCSRLYAGEGAEHETQTLKALLATVVGSISAVVFFSIVFLNAGSLNAFILAGETAVLANLYAFFYTAFVVYKRRRQGTPLGSKLIVAIVLLAITLIGSFVAWELAIRFA